MGSKESGRRRKYSAPVHEIIIRQMKAGALKYQACAAAGVSMTACDEWLIAGRAGDSDYVQFARDFDTARAADALELQGLILRAAKSPKKRGDWKAAAWLLARKYPKQYGARAVEAPPPAPLERPYSPFNGHDVPPEPPPSSPLNS